MTDIIDSINNISINSAVHKILTIYESAAQNMRIQYKNIQQYLSRNKSWWDEKCSEIKLHKYAALRKFRWTNDLQDFKNYVDRRKHFKKTCYIKKRLFQHNKRQELLKNSKCPKTFWQMLKTNNRNDTFQIQNIEPDTWKEYFQSLLFNNDLPRLNYIDFIENTINNEQNIVLNSEITRDEILKSINKLKNGKSQGKDGIGA